MASGRPIIAYKAGGALETIADGKTGIFFEKQEKQSLLGAVSRFEKIDWESLEIREHAKNLIKKYLRRRYWKLLKNPKHEIRDSEHLEF